MRALRRFLINHAVGVLTVAALLAGGWAFLARSWISTHGEVALVWVTLGLLWVTGWYAATTRRIAGENQQLVKETQRLAAVSSRSLLVESIPVVAVRELESRGRESPAHLVLQNVGQAAAIVNRVRVELGRHGGPRQTLDSRESGSDVFFNLGQGHGHALAAGGEMLIDLAHSEPPASGQSGLVDFDATESACDVEYADAVGNQFLARHELGRSLALSVMVPDRGWQPLTQGFTVHVRSGRLVPGHE